ncbi:hypothetical protein OSTOST_02353 [Ostertagia ostertagi]
MNSLLTIPPYLHRRKPVSPNVIHDISESEQRPIEAIVNYEAKMNSLYSTQRNIAFDSPALTAPQNRLKKQPLPDVLLTLFPEQEWAYHMAHFLVLATLACFCALLVLHQLRAFIARRFLFIGATLFTYRSLTLMVTQLPSGYGNFDKRCREQANITFDIFLSRVTEQALRFGFQNNAKILCGDMLFSGHTVAVVTSALFVAYYLPPRLQFLRWIPYLLAASAATCLIISHTHYTIDILVAYWLSNFVFRYVKLGFKSNKEQQGAYYISDWRRTTRFVRSTSSYSGGTPYSMGTRCFGLSNGLRTISPPEKQQTSSNLRLTVSSASCVKVDAAKDYMEELMSSTYVELWSYSDHAVR